MALRVDRAARRQDRRGRFDGEARNNGLAGRNAAENAARVVGKENGLSVRSMRISSAFSSPEKEAQAKPSPISTPLTALMLMKAAAISWSASNTVPIMN